MDIEDLVIFLVFIALATGIGIGLYLGEERGDIKCAPIKAELEWMKTPVCYEGIQLSKNQSCRYDNTTIWAVQDANITIVHFTERIWEVDYEN